MKSWFCAMQSMQMRSVGKLPWTSGHLLSVLWFVASNSRHLSRGLTPQLSNATSVHSVRAVNHGLRAHCLLFLDVRCVFFLALIKAMTRDSARAPWAKPPCRCCGWCVGRRGVQPSWNWCRTATVDTSAGGSSAWRHQGGRRERAAATAAARQSWGCPLRQGGSDPRNLHAKQNRTKIMSCLHCWTQGKDK